MKAKTVTEITVPPDALVLKGSFGVMSIFALDRKDKQTATNRVVVKDTIKTLPVHQPFSIKGRLKPFLEQMRAGTVVSRMLRPNETAFVWVVPDYLDVTDLFALDKKAKLPQALNSALEAICKALTEFINPAELRRYAFDVLKIDDSEYAQGFVRSAPEWELFNGEIAQSVQKAALGKLSGRASIQLEDIVKVVRASRVSLENPIGALRSELYDPCHSLYLRSYESESLVVKPAYRAVSGLVEEIAIRSRIPALLDAPDGCPGLWLSGVPDDYCSTLEAAVIPGLELVDDEGQSVSAVALDITERWDSWPSHIQKVTRAWHQSTRRHFESIAKEHAIGAIASVPKEKLLPRIARSAEWIAYAIERFDAEGHPLSWRQYVETENHRSFLRTDNMRSAVLLSLASELHGETVTTVSNLAVVSESMQQIAREIEDLMTSALSLAKALGTAKEAVEAIEVPLVAAIGAMRAANPVRLAGGSGAAELMLAGLLEARSIAPVASNES